MKSVITEESLMVELTDSERLDRAKQAAAVEADIVRVEAEKKDAMADFREKLKSLKQSAGELHSAVRTGQEEAMVQVESTFDLDKKTVKVRRVSSGSLVRERRMSPDEVFQHSQAELPGTDAGIDDLPPAKKVKAPWKRDGDDHVRGDYRCKKADGKWHVFSEIDGQEAGPFDTLKAAKTHAEEEVQA